MPSESTGASTTGPTGNDATPPAPPWPSSHTPPAILGTLGQLVKGLAVLFWGCPIALVVGIQTAKGEWFRPLGILPALVASGLLCLGLGWLGQFQPQERVWRAALDRLQALALVNLGLSPFLYWWSRIPSQFLFAGVMQSLTLTGILFLLLLNPMLVRLTAMLPEETLRLETRFFASLNEVLFSLLFLLTASYFTLIHIDPGLPDQFLGWLLKISPLPPQVNAVIYFLDRAGQMVLLFLVLPPLAMTMALIWKIKEVILAGVFGHPPGSGSQA